MSMVTVIVAEKDYKLKSKSYTDSALTETSFC